MEIVSVFIDKKFDIVNLEILPKLICRFSSIQKFLLFMEANKLILKFMQKYKETGMSNSTSLIIDMLWHWVD